jgi:prepilin-type N-terminal cleavage/methylation domain-containing protein
MNLPPSTFGWIKSSHFLWKRAGLRGTRRGEVRQHRHTPRHPHPNLSPVEMANGGFTLLEIIISLAILAGALAALGEVMRMAGRSASSTEDETQAQILAASIMDELVAQARDLTAVTRAPIDEEGVDPLWVYSIETQPTSYEALVAVKVKVEQALDARLQPSRFELVRWLPNPDYVPPQANYDQSSSSTSSSSSGSSSSSSGGSKK